MSFSQNQFAMSTSVGTLLWGTNIMTCRFYSASPSDTLAPGEFVCLASTTNGGVSQVVKGSGLTSRYTGMALVNVLKGSWAVGDELEVAIFGSAAYATAGSAVTAGDFLQYDYTTGYVATQTGQNTIVAQAIENAVNSGDLIRCIVMPAAAGSDTGPTGAQGVQGNQGYQGKQGNQGNQGNQAP